MKVIVIIFKAWMFYANNLIARWVYNNETLNVGRVNLVDLQQALNVDFMHIESKVNDLLRSEKNLKLILGQLISR